VRGTDFTTGSTRTGDETSVFVSNPSLRLQFRRPESFFFVCAVVSSDTVLLLLLSPLGDTTRETPVIAGIRTVEERSNPERRLHPRRIGLSLSFVFPEEEDPLYPLYPP